MTDFDKCGLLQVNRVPMHAVTICIALLMAVTSLSACSEAQPPPGTGRVVDKDGKPVAGVHVLSWRHSSIMPWFPFTRPSRSCDAEHYSVTGDDGAFMIPSEVIKRPRSADASDMAIIAYKSGMAMRTTKLSVTPTFAPPNRLGVDIFPTKENPLVVEILVVNEPETSELYVERLHSLDSSAGCHMCSPFRRLVHSEVLRRYEENKRNNPQINYADLIPRNCP